MEGRRIAHPRGKVLGGSSSINGMIFQRGNPLDYERWAGDSGMQGWDYAHCLPYFKRMETCLAGADTWRGGSGPLMLERGPATNPLFEAFFAAAGDAGLSAGQRPGYRQEGFAKFDRNIHRGRRLSAARAYLHHHASPEPRRTHAGARDVGEVRGSASRRHRVRAGGKRAALGPHRRSDSLRWRHQHAADTAALRRRERALARVLKRSRRRGPAGRRRQPAGSSRGVRPVRKPPARVRRSGISWPKKFGVGVQWLLQRKGSGRRTTSKLAASAAATRTSTIKPECFTSCRWRSGTTDRSPLPVTATRCTWDRCTPMRAAPSVSGRRIHAASGIAVQLLRPRTRTAANGWRRFASRAGY